MRGITKGLSLCYLASADNINLCLDNFPYPARPQSLYLFLSQIRGRGGGCDKVDLMSNSTRNLSTNVDKVKNFKSSKNGYLQCL